MDVRMFIALRIPPAQTRHLREFLDASGCLAGAAAPRLTEPDRWHITLVFFGDLPADKAGRLGDILVASKLPTTGQASPLRLSGGGRFGSTVAWVGVQPSDWLARLAQDVSRIARSARCGPPDEGHRGAWQPHVTVARGRGAGPATAKLVATVDAYRGPRWLPSEVVLVRSHLGPSPRHDVVATATLATTLASP